MNRGRCDNKNAARRGMDRERCDNKNAGPKGMDLGWTVKSHLEERKVLKTRKGKHIDLNPKLELYPFLTTGLSFFSAVLKAGVDKISVTWILNGTVKSGSDSSYKTVEAKLCYAPVSQVDRAWRKTEDDLSKDKTCQFLIVGKPYNPANKTVQKFEWTVARDIPTGTFFVRAYAFNSAGEEVGYGQTTDNKKGTNLFQIESITGRHISLDIASVCFSAFSVLSLSGFFLAGKRKAKKAEAPGQ